MSAPSIKMISVDQIFPNPDNLRELTNADEKAIEQLGQEIKSVGQQLPLIVYPHPQRPGDYMLRDGHRRRLGMMQAGVREASCIVVESDGVTGNVVTMLTTGRNQKPLSKLEEAKGFQMLLDLGMTELQMSKKFRQKTTDIRAKAKISQAPVLVQSFYEGGGMNLEEAQKLQELEDTDPEMHAKVLDRIENDSWTQRQIMNGNTSITRLIVEQKEKKAHLARKAELEAAGAKQAPENYYSNTRQVREEMTDAEHIAAGHLYALTGMHTDWREWIKTPPEVTPADDEEAKEKAKKLRSLNAALAVDYQMRRKFLVAQMQAKECVSQAEDQRILFAYLEPSIMQLPDDLLEELTGISSPEDSNDYVARIEWKKKVSARISTWGWRQWARLVTWKQHWDTDRRLRSTRGLGESWDHKNRYREFANWFDLLQASLGYTMTDTEREGMDYMEPEEIKEPGAQLIDIGED